MSDSPQLSLPFLLSSQAQKEVTHNEALSDLDCLVQLAVIDQNLTVPPSSPLEGDAYIVGVSATGLWSDKDLQVAYYYNGWRFKNPKEGWVCFVKDEIKFYVFVADTWQLMSGFVL